MSARTTLISVRFNEIRYAVNGKLPGGKYGRVVEEALRQAGPASETYRLRHVIEWMRRKYGTKNYRNSDGAQLSDEVETSIAVPE